MKSKKKSVVQSELLDVHDTFNEKDSEVWHIIRLFYQVKCAEGEVVLSKDHDKYQWVSLDGIDDKQEIIQNLIPILQKAR